jgi:tetratricopeptide (TPR) repeat protein
MSQAPQSTPTPPLSTDDTAEPFVVSLPDDPNSRRDWYLWAGVLALLTMVSFWPAISGGFLWNDSVNVTQNQAVQDSQGLATIWSPSAGATQYYPLTQTSYWVEYQLWKNWPLGFRVVNLVLHAAGALVLWRLLRRLALPGAWVAAALWAVHPLQAESVCWVSERSNVLSALLAFTSLLFYLEFAGLRDPGSSERIWKLTDDWQLYLISLAFFAAALLSKTWVCGLPLAIFLILWWQRKLTAKTFGGLIPLLAIGAGLALLTIHIESNPAGPIGATGKPWEFPLAVRVMAAGQALWFYAYKLIWPTHQSFSYVREVPDLADKSYWLFLEAAGVILVAALIFVRRIGRGPLVALLCYLIALFPTLGFVSFYSMLYSFLWDHFQYIASAPLIVLGVSIIARIISPSSFRPRAQTPAPSAPPEAGSVSMAVVIPAAIAAIVLGVFASASWLRAQVFVSSPSLWEDTVAKNPISWLASLQLGQEKMGSANAMIEQGAKFANTDPDTSKASYDAASDDLHDAEDLIVHTINSPTAIDSARMTAYCELGGCKNLRVLIPGANIEEHMREAIQDLKEAITLEKEQDKTRPDALPYFTIGISAKNLAEYLEKQLTPRDLQASTRPTQKVPTSTRPATASQRKVLDKFDDAREYLAEAIDVAKSGAALPTTHAESLRVLELASYNRGDIDFQLAGLVLGRGERTLTDKYNADAITDYALSLEVNPRREEAQYRIALCYERFHRWDDAMAHLKIILYSLNHRNARALNEIGNVLLARPNASVADLNLAIHCFQDSLSITPNFTDARNNLANAMVMLKQVNASTQPTTAPATAPAGHS